MTESSRPKDPYDFYLEEAKEFKLPETTQKILQGVNPFFWKLAARARYDSLVFIQLYSKIEDHLKSQAVFDAMVDFLNIRTGVSEREKVIENERQRLIGSLEPQFRRSDSDSQNNEADFDEEILN